MQGAGSQWRQRLGKPSRWRPAPMWILGFGRGVSSVALKRPRVLEWAVAHAVRHCMHPTHRSGWTMTCFIAAPSLCALWGRLRGGLVRLSVSILLVGHALGRGPTGCRPLLGFAFAPPNLQEQARQGASAAGGRSGTTHPAGAPAGSRAAPVSR